MGASLCTRGIAKRRADRADLDGPATSVRAPAEQHRTLGDPRCLRDDERVLARCPLRRPVCGSSLHDPSVPDRSDRSPVLVGRQRRREASGPIRPARPCAGTPGPNRRPEDPQRGPSQSSVSRRTIRRSGPTHGYPSELRPDDRGTGSCGSWDGREQAEQSAPSAGVSLLRTVARALVAAAGIDASGARGCGRALTARGRGSHVASGFAVQCRRSRAHDGRRLTSGACGQAA